MRRLQTSVREVKESREMGAKYMTFQELLDDERAAGREEGREEGIPLGEWKKIKSQVAKKLEKGDSIKKIADDLVEDISVIQKAIDELTVNNR